MSLAGVNGSIAVSKTEGWGSNPWRGAKYFALLLAFVTCFSFSHEVNRNHVHKKAVAQKVHKKKVQKKTAKKDTRKAKQARQVVTDPLSYLVFNNGLRTLEYTKNVETVRPIASVTKLMTAMVALNYDLDLSRKLSIQSKVGGSLPRNRMYTREELLSAMLVKSDNSAAETLASDYPGGRSVFIQEMNKFSRVIGMQHTNFDDPTGLSASNTSTALDVAAMVAKAAQYTMIRETSTKQQIEIDTYGKKKMRKLVLNNTNRPVLFNFDDIVVSKTGFTTRAGFCLALAVERNGQRYSVVILGSNNKQSRISKAEDILKNHILEVKEKSNIDA